MRRFFVLITVLAGCLANTNTRLCCGANDDPIARLKAGEWYEVPNSQLKDVAAKVADFPWLSGGIGGITACWAGGAFDSQRDRLYVGPGGGHAGYNGNEVYAFDLNDMKWHRLNDPDPVIPGTENTDPKVAPFAMHTYDAVEYLPPPVDRYVVVGGWATPPTYALDPDHPNRWEVYAGHGTHRTGDLCGYDPVGGMLWLSTPITAGKLSQWDPLAHRWTLRLNESPETSYYETADVDWKRRLLVSCGKGKVKTWSLTPVPKGVTFNLLQTTGDTDIINSPSPGFCYVPLLERFVAWGSGADVYTLDLEQKRWTKHPPAATNTATPGPPDQWGTFGRFRYVPSRNVFVVCNAADRNIFIYRLTEDRPNVITGVAAKATAAIETDVPAAAITVEALYADGTRKNVTDVASYFSLDPAIAQVDLHGKGVIRPLATGTARIRAVYSDPAFKRGFAHEVKIEVRPIGGNVQLDTLQASFNKLTVVSGDTYQLEAQGAFTRGTDPFTRRCTDLATWSSSAPEIATVAKGLITATGKSGSATITAQYQGKSCQSEVNIKEQPVIRRIAFQVKDTAPRAGWNAESGQLFSEERGYGWLSVEGLAMREDRNRASRQLFKSFNTAQNKQFKLQVPAGPYQVRVAMGDDDYGAVPFSDFVAFGSEKLLYYEGHHNDVDTEIVNVPNDGLVLTVNGPINYLIVAPVGIDLDKYAGDTD